MSFSPSSSVHPGGTLADQRRGAALSRLRLTDFRCYSALNLDIDPARPFVALSGANGAGKTNVLEAVSYLAPGRGLRGAALADITRRSATHWAVASVITDRDGGTTKIGTGLDPAASARRAVRIDGVPQSGTHSLGDYVALLWLTPQMDRLFLEGPSGRRKFLDRMVLALTPDHSSQIAAYERAMREHNRLLADGYRGDLDPWLTGLETQMAAHGVAIAAARLEALAALQSQLAAHTASAFPQPDIALDGSLEAALHGGVAASDLEHDYRAHLEAARPYDLGRTREGVHKSDLMVRYSAKDMPAEQCSTGEQKALLISLVLAQAEVIAARRGAPILLLDEVAAHLDGGRRDALFDRLMRTGAQVWLTGTDDQIFAAVHDRATRFAVDPAHHVTRITQGS